MNEADILKWAAGAPLQLPAFDSVRDDRLLYFLGIDEEELISLIGRHRLANRFVDRYRRERPTWCSRALLASVIHQTNTAERQAKRQLALLREVRQALAERGHPLLPIKGFTAYAFTGNPAHIRWGEDLDLFFCDLQALHQTLFALGFTERATFRFNQFDLVSCEDLESDDTTPAPLVNGQHELAKMARGEEKVEIHGYFPMFTYPPGVRQTDLVPAHNPGQWKQAFPNTVARGILYKDLVASAIPGTAPDTQDLLIPEPALSVLLRCAHVFAHYVLVGPFEDWMPLKLVELAEIRDIVLDARFDRSRFGKLIHKFGGQDAVDLVGFLLKSYLGSEALSFACSSPRSLPGHFPRFFQWWRFWTTYQTADTLDALLLPSHLDTVITQLGTNTLSVGSGKISPVYSVHAQGIGQALERVIVHSQQGQEIALQLSVTLEGRELAFTVEILEPPPDAEHRYQLDLIGRHTIQSTYLHAIAADSPGWTEAPGRPPKHVSHHRYKWPDPSDPFLVLLAFGVQDTRRDFFFSFDPALLIPLKIVRV